jgi:Flp pilus assembly protein TadG
MAIVLPVLILLVFGIIDFSRIFSGIIAAQQGAREGVRLAALAPNYTTTQAIDRAKVTGNSPFASTASNFSAALASPACNTTPAPETVTMSASFTFTGILFFSSGKTFTETAQMRCGG